MSSLETTKAEFDCSEAFYYIWNGWRLAGTIPPAKPKNLYKIWSFFAIVSALVLVPLHLLLGTLLILDDFEKLMLHVSMSLESSCVSAKMACAYINRRKLYESHEYLKNLDKRVKENDCDQQRMEKIVRNCRRIYLFFMTLFAVDIILYAILAAFTNKLMFDGWFPFDWKSSTQLYIAAFAYQVYFISYQDVIVSGCDTFPILYTYVLMGNIKCLARRVSKIGYNDGGVLAQDLDENYKELVRCIDYHQNILRFLSSITPAISGTIFLEFIIQAVVLGSSTIGAIKLSHNVPYLVRSFLFTLSIIAEVLPCCYIVSAMTQESDRLTMAIYSCNWMDQSAKFRRTLIIFMQRTQLENIILAGNMYPISLQTFMGIIKVSYSIFTLFSSA